MSYTSNTALVPRAKGLLIATAAFVGLLGGTMFGTGVAYADPQICLQSNRIDHTEILSKTQILFYMNGKEVWLNTLPHPCSMDRTDGFVWKSSIPQYCDNLETIKIIRTGQTCMLGKFTPYEKPSKPS